MWCRLSDVKSAFSASLSVNIRQSLPFIHRFVTQNKCTSRSRLTWRVVTHASCSSFSQTKWMQQRIVHGQTWAFLVHHATELDTSTPRKIPFVITTHRILLFAGELLISNACSSALEDYGWKMHDLPQSLREWWNNWGGYRIRYNWAFQRLKPTFPLWNLPTPTPPGYKMLTSRCLRYDESTVGENRGCNLITS